MDSQLGTHMVMVATNTLLVGVEFMTPLPSCQILCAVPAVVAAIAALAALAAQVAQAAQAAMKRLTTLDFQSSKH